MRKLILLAGAAGLAISAPVVAASAFGDLATEQKGGGGGNDRGGGRGSGGGSRADRGGQGGGPARAVRQERRQERAERQERRQDREVRRAERGPERRIERAERRDERRIERAERRDDRRIERAERRDDRNLRRVEREVRRAERRPVRLTNADEVVRLSRPRGDGFGIGGCPPGLARRNNGCIPPGLERQQLRAQLAQQSWYDNWWGYPAADRSYFYDDGYLYRLGNGGSVAAFLPLLGGALWPGQAWPSAYQAAPVPDYFVDYYGLNDGYDYRFADGVVYGIDPETDAIRQVAALLTGDDWAIGQRMPDGYGVYNVPYQYREQYADGPDAWYRYSDGYVYQVDPTTQLIQAAIQLIV